MKRLVNVLAVKFFVRDMKMLCHISVLHLFIVRDRKLGRAWARKVLNNFWMIFPPVFYVRRIVRRVVRNTLWYLRFVGAFIKLTHARLRHGECFIRVSDYCCDSGRHVYENRYTNPFSAVRSLHYLNGGEAARYADGPIAGYIGDGTMWHDSNYHYVQAPGGWAALRADQESEDDERFEREMSDRQW